MPQINRIRVNNVKYNFGTQAYDNFTMKLFGKNTIYDLANGGGKSVLMLLLLQNLIPNCTLDDKQPIEKLFRANSGNTTIHSLVEWKLDAGDITDNYSYMTTGFCARKAKDGQDDSVSKKDTATIEYFNYCIFYRKYNENDIINLPLSNGKERITYTGLRNYIKDLEKNDLGLKVFLFDKKGEYQKFIARYGLYESEWEIIRGINKTEGHVRTYFETNYKTTRKVVEDLLIEEIIEKSFNSKIDNNATEDDMAKTLLDIKDKIIELTKKKKDIVSYDRQIELLNVLKARINTFISVYREKSDSVSNIVDIYNTVEQIKQEYEADTQRVLSLKDDKENEKRKILLSIEQLNIAKDKVNLKIANSQLDSLSSQLSEMEAERSEYDKKLKLNESINDYIDYLKDKQLKEESEEIINNVHKKDESTLKQLQTYAFNKKQRNEEKLKNEKELLIEVNDKLDKAYDCRDLLAQDIYKLEIEKGITKGDIWSNTSKLGDTNNKIKNLRDKGVALVLGGAKETLAANKSRQWEIKKEKNILNNRIVENNEQLINLKLSLAQLQNEKKEKNKQLEKLINSLDEYEQVHEKIAKLKKVYEIRDDSKISDKIEDLYDEVLSDRSILNKRLKELNMLATALDSKCPMDNSESVNKVVDYIITRHGAKAESGLHFICGLKQSEKERILDKFPLLPYGVITDKYSSLLMDTNLKDLDIENQAVPIFNRESLKVKTNLFESNIYSYVLKDKKYFTNQDIIDEEKEKTQKKIENVKNSIIKLNEKVDILKGDLLYLNQNVEFIEVDDINETLSDVRKNIEQIETRINEENFNIIELTEKLREDKNTVGNIESEIVELINDYNILTNISEYESISDGLEKQLRILNEKSNQIDRDISKKNNDLQQCDIEIVELEGKTKALKDNICVVENEWNSIYSKYFLDGEFEELTIVDSVLETKFKALREIYEKDEIAHEDKRALIDTLKVSMNRSLRAIKRRGVSLNDLENRGELLQVDEDTLSTLSNRLRELDSLSAILDNQIKNQARNNDKLEGKIEELINNINKQGAAYNDVELSITDIERKIQQGMGLLEKCGHECLEAEKKCRTFINEKTNVLDLYKDLQRIIEVYDISTEDGKKLKTDIEWLKTEFNSSLKKFDSNNKQIEKNNVELTKYIHQTVDTLKEMGAFELADNINNDMNVPKDISEATILVNNIEAINSYIELEKSRISKGIDDMQFIKENFENQCVQRCLDVKTELDRLPKLSRISLDNKPIQIINLNIPYVKDEFYSQRMSNYIDSIVDTADKYETSEERMRYIRGQLSLKKLFAVIVSDMNAIKLNLYKRERIKEQSRFLRYEEAVGSTGQSQGIYIQFLVAIINYISNINSTTSENDQLGKVIFIDNPFGAAKDVYIWEPIFELLKTNCIQLIVPARGATPAITNRFEVNYILGQKMVGSRQLTVVADYRSEIYEEQLEYRRLEFEQESFDFI